MDRRIIKTKKAIQSAYFELLSSGKKKKITISAIARKANIYRKTFYLHYDSPEDIAREYCNTKTKDFTEAIDERLKNPGETLTLELFFDVLTEFILGNLKLVTFLASIRDNSFFYEEIKNEIVQSIIRYYAEDLNFSEEDATIFADFYLSGILSSYRLWADRRITVSIEELAEKLRDAALNGIVSVIRKNSETNS